MRNSIATSGSDMTDVQLYIKSPTAVFLLLVS